MFVALPFSPVLSFVLTVVPILNKFNILRDLEIFFCYMHNYLNINSINFIKM